MWKDWGTFLIISLNFLINNRLWSGHGLDFNLGLVGFVTTSVTHQTSLLRHTLLHCLEFSIIKILRFSPLIYKTTVVFSMKLQQKNWISLPLSRNVNRQKKLSPYQKCIKPKKIIIKLSIISRNSK